MIGAPAASRIPTRLNMSGIKPDCSLNRSIRSGCPLRHTRAATFSASSDTWSPTGSSTPGSCEVARTTA